ncbi:hypothetical protein F511_35307 [Dorcoceras hygrometricum]|uniref:Uncharacterized protein n=1 Tax=Dorcoceras hygrometricum TaxID=472368 RepID=A0A2Z7B4Q3_9LAMI|nr:hypothetical protein F511_35307 [Dorcoceras hygrometricum]
MMIGKLVKIMMIGKLVCRNMWQLRTMICGLLLDDPMKIMKANMAVAISKCAPHMVENPRYEWITEDIRKSNLDNVAKDILFEMLDKNMLGKIKICIAKKDIREKLTQLCEVKE